MKTYPVRPGGSGRQSAGLVQRHVVVMSTRGKPGQRTRLRVGTTHCTDGSLKSPEHRPAHCHHQGVASRNGGDDSSGDDDLSSGDGSDDPSAEMEVMIRQADQGTALTRRKRVYRQLQVIQDRLLEEHRMFCSQQTSRPIWTRDTTQSISSDEIVCIIYSCAIM